MEDEADGAVDFGRGLVVHHERVLGVVHVVGGGPVKSEEKKVLVKKQIEISH